MIFNTFLASSALFLVIISIVVQSIPIEKAKEIVSTSLLDHKQADKQELLKSVDSAVSSSNSLSSTTSSTTISLQNLPTEQSSLKQNKKDHKSKRNVINNDQFNRFLTSESDESSEQASSFSSNVNNNEQILHTKIEETPVNVHENADKPVNTDDSSIFSEIKMTPNELTDIVRRRRDVKSNVESNQRHKRALSSYDLYDTDALYDPYVDLVEAHIDARPTRSFAPIYWYPSVYERNIRAADFAPSFYESSDWPQLYSANIINDNVDDDDNDNLASLYGKNDDDDDDDVTDYELNRYPILLQSINNPYDNLQLQQQYNTDDLPLDDDDIDESLNDDEDVGDNYEAQYRSIYGNQYPYNTRYGSLDTYFE